MKTDQGLTNSNIDSCAVLSAQQSNMVGLIALVENVLNGKEGELEPFVW